MTVIGVACFGGASAICGLTTEHQAHQLRPLRCRQRHAIPATQGQYLAVIYTCVLLNRQARGEADFQRFFCVTAPRFTR